MHSLYSKNVSFPELINSSVNFPSFANEEESTQSLGNVLYVFASVVAACVVAISVYLKYKRALHDGVHDCWMLGCPALARTLSENSASNEERGSYPLQGGESAHFSINVIVEGNRVDFCSRLVRDDPSLAMASNPNDSDHVLRDDHCSGSVKDSGDNDRGIVSDCMGDSVPSVHRGRESFQ